MLFLVARDEATLYEALSVHYQLSLNYHLRGIHMAMQNFMEIGPIVFAGECVGTKIGCLSYNTYNYELEVTIILFLLSHRKKFHRLSYVFWHTDLPYHNGSTIG